MSDFEAYFYNGYPRKVGREYAEECYDHCIKDGYSREDIKAGLIISIKNWTTEGTEPKHIPHPSTYLNQHRFVGGLTVDVATLSKKPYDQFTDDDWRVYIFAEQNLDHAKKYMPSHIKKESGFGLELVKATD